ncbi:helix-turn-helix domain-containing protein [Streptomyces alkaliterrae]|uniref:Helix-turn-helix domain-containing protein n=1 Tax=Streptomyces alkaliterrae TaxID=2213162 RepID=A0A5P0YQY4_9ACTN|nr:helix-turn-helix domain-containing protein [Streptomyces alkaliterrae]MBB1252101.1 helix-turn-helix domain-containing protein [Streptomyces alkaliterrae]MBB1261288.1 helix-turn-helix domain-containing protein [Streptomyces alkaliterrae]MQS02320.1 helix-turn-helix domain-containing protein [Streptomyces alkaliterrae]
MNKAFRSWRGPKAAVVGKVPNQHDCPTAFGQAVYDRRTQLAWSQAELAHRAGLEEADIDRIERGDATPSLHLLCRLNEAMSDQLSA